MKILLTGDAGYIGSRTCVALAQAGHDLVIIDKLSNNFADVIDRLATLCGKLPQFIQGDVRDAYTLDRIFADHPIGAVIHFAGLKAVGESSEKPLEYYDNNVTGALQLLAAMQRAGVKTLVSLRQPLSMVILLASLSTKTSRAVRRIPMAVPAYD